MRLSELKQIIREEVKRQTRRNSVRLTEAVDSEMEALLKVVFGVRDMKQLKQEFMDDMIDNDYNPNDIDEVESYLGLRARGVEEDQDLMSPKERKAARQLIKKYDGMQPKVVQYMADMFKK
jgi:hypothetical protein